MKRRIICISAGLLLAVSAAAILPRFAAAVNPNEVPPEAAGRSGYDPSQTGGGQLSGGGRPTAGAGGGESVNPKNTDVERTISCWYPWNWMLCVAQPTANAAMWLSARLLWIAGILLNLSVYYTLNMSTLLTTLPIVDIGWKIIRDIANIVFIFIALWSGLSIILDIKAERAWGLVAQMVLVALFINFSLFITKAVVDASNIAAWHFYSLIKQPQQANAPNANDWDGGLSEAFMYGLKIQSLYDTRQIEKIAAGESNYVGAVSQQAQFSTVNVVLIGALGSAVMVVAAFVFFAAAIMFIIRAVTLIMLMILSPLAFVAWLLPGAASLAQKWWSTLWSQSFFAPLYMALAYVVVATINNQNFQGVATLGAQKISFAAAFTGFNSSSVVIVLNFVIIIGLLLACLIVAQSLGGKSAEMGIAFAKKIGGETTGLIGRTAVRGFHFREGGVGAWAGEKLAKGLGLGKEKGVGKFLSTLGGREMGIRKLDEKFEKSTFGQTAFGKFLRGQTTERAAGATFGGTKSAQEAYEEHEEMVTRRREISLAAEAKEKARPLQKLRAEESGLFEERLQLEKEASAQDGLIEKTRQAEEAATDPAEKARLAGVRTTQEQKKTEIATRQEENKKKIQTFKNTNGRAIQEYTEQVSQALAKMTPEGFLHQQKTFFAIPELMDVAVLGADKYDALMRSNDFTKTEKEEYTEARLKRTKEVAKRRKERNELYLKAQPGYRRALDKYEAEVEKIEKASDLPAARQNLKNAQAEVKKLQTELKELQEDNAPPKTLKAQREKIKQATQEVSRLESDVSDRVVKSRREMDAQKLAPPKRPEQPGWDEAPEIRKALRNILSPEQVLNFYRYDRDALNLNQIVDTIKQGTWNDVRRRPEMDSVSMEQFRVTKRHYVRDACYYSLGLDPIVMEKLAEKDAAAAQHILESFNEKMKELGPDEYFKQFQALGLESELKTTLARYTDDETGKPLQDDASAAERSSRFRVGETMYADVAENLAPDEFTMMPGLLRNQYLVMRHLDRGTAVFYENRDLEDTLPHVELWLQELKRFLLRRGKITAETLSALNWLVNEDRGQRFTKFESIRPELKPIFEMAKAYVANTARASRSMYGAVSELKEAVEQLQRSEGVTPMFENPFLDAGYIGEFFQEKRR